MKYDVVIIGAGPGGIFSAYELMKQNNDLKIAVFEAGNPLSKRHCPIDTFLMNWLLKLRFLERTYSPC